ncbi:hybrid sensor histidine kinase/response regulator transcription factor [Sphingobacterium corticibacterium]|nr:hybrid sensor histidine kinase/response regulator transcription factor [Sphingobacterium corticibacterium]
MKKYSLLFCFFIFFLQCAFAIDTSRYRFHVMPETSYYGGIQSIAKDSLGRIWYTGTDAIFMYDGNSFHQLDELVSALNPTVKWGYGSLIASQRGELFLFTNHALLRFDYEQFKFHIAVQRSIRSACQHDDGKLYILSRDSLLWYDSQNNTLNGFQLPKDKFYSKILSLNGDLYVSHESTLYKLHQSEKQLVPFIHLDKPSHTLVDVLEYEGLYYHLTQRGGIFVTDTLGTIRRHIPVSFANNQPALAKGLFLDQTGVIWVATQVGLFLYNPIKEERGFLRLNLNDPFSLPNNSIWTIYADPNQGAWIGTYGGKIAYCSLYDAHVRYFNPSPGGLNHPIVSSFQEDQLGNMWIGTEGGGLNYWDRKNDSFHHFIKSSTDSPNSNMIKRLRFDSENQRLLISAFSGGLTAYDPAGRTFNDLHFFFPGSRQPLTIYDFVQDEEGTWWMTDPNQPFLYKRKKNADTEIVKIIGANDEKLNLDIATLYLDNQYNLRLITQQGLYVVDRNTLKVLKHYLIQDAPYSANNLSCHHESSNGDLWLGTLGRGVNVLKKDGTYLNFNSNNGFPPKMVFGILEDDSSKRIWLSTSDGIYSYNPKSTKFEKARFYKENKCGSFYIRAAYKTAKGELFFGGTNGFLLFDPAHTGKNPQKPRVFFTGFLVNNTEVTASSASSPLSKDISSLSNRRDERIRLSNSESNIEIRFSANSYLAADKNQFAYRMRGISDNWTVVNTPHKSVQFFNLSSGSYTFEIKASNNDGLWGDDISRLYLHIDPPFFLSWWAYCFYSLIVISLLFFIIRYYTDKKMFQERLALEALKEQNILKLNQARTDFFTNISHDLKTPLTLVLQPLKQLKETLDANNHATVYMQLIEKNVSRIQRMISQLLRFREIESQKVTLHPQVGDIINFVRDVFSLFELYANKKEIETNISAYKDQVYVAFDYDIVEKILTNLFSNALKYTPNKGYVGVRIYSSTEEEKARLPQKRAEAELEYISIEVLNSGDGFSEQQIATLFTSFNRLSSHRPTFEESSGLGLAIVKELVDVLKGNIWMVNKTNKISFTIILPLKKEASTGSMRGNVYDYTISEIDDVMLDDTEPDSPTKNARKANSLLLIEDDPAMRTYLEQRLSQKYNIYTASDGMEGIIKAEKIYPQLIITDLIMPNGNGFEVCRRLRQNFKTSHIPIVMISGVGEENQNKIKALEYGATVFIDKPFDIEYLLQQTEAILKNQQELREMYSKRLVVDPAKVTITSMDEELLVRAMKFIELNIANPLYSVDDFVSDMNVGRTILYQKIHDIVGMSIKEFILNIRLKRSAYLLEQSDLTIAEIAYQTGFNNAKYFSVCFKKQFDMSPSEFKKKSLT